MKAAYFEMHATRERLLWQTSDFPLMVAPQTLPFALLRFSSHLISLFSTAVLGHCAGDGKPPEKQVATIAQKIIDAKHTEQDRRRPITASNPGAFTFGTSLPDHVSILRERFSGSCGAGVTVILCVLRRARNISISRVIRSADSARVSSFML